MTNTLYERIKERRKELRMSQEALAIKMGYSDKSMISKIEKGKVDLSSSKVEQFANALQTSAFYLMGWTSDPSEEPDEAQWKKDLRSVDILTAYWMADEKIRKAVDLLLGISEEE